MVLFGPGYSSLQRSLCAVNFDQTQSREGAVMWLRRHSFPLPAPKVLPLLKIPPTNKSNYVFHTRNLFRIEFYRRQLGSKVCAGTFAGVKHYRWRLWAASSQGGKTRQAVFLFIYFFCCEVKTGQNSSPFSLAGLVHQNGSNKSDVVNKLMLREISSLFSKVNMIKGANSVFQDDI